MSGIVTRSLAIDMNTTIFRKVDGKEVEVPVRMIGRKLHVLRGTTGKFDGVGHKKGALYITDQRANHNQLFEILAVSEDCRYFSEDEVGAWIQLPANPIGVSYPVGKRFEELFVKESYWERKNEKGQYPALCVFRKE